MRDHYEILGVSASSETEVVEAAYRALMKKYHPDVSRSTDRERAAQINVAYETLRDPVKKAAYDRDRERNKTRGESRSAPSPVPGNSDHAEDLLKVCPECAEDVQGSARVCRFCGHRFVEDSGAASHWTRGATRDDGSRSMGGKRPASDRIADGNDWSEHGKKLGCVAVGLVALVIFGLSLPEGETNSEIPVGQAADAPVNDAAAPTKFIPERFLGEWNDVLADCGTANNDSRLRIEPSRLLFSGSEAEVENVEVLHDRSVAIEATFSGEGEVRNEKITLVLSGSGKELSTGAGDSRRRCPALTGEPLQQSEAKKANHAPVAASEVTVPEAFHGRWAVKPNGCRPGSAKNITSVGVGDRAAGDLTAVKRVSPVSIELQFKMADEGGPFTYSERWTISSDRRQLLLESPEDGSQFTFTRC